MKNIAFILLIASLALPLPLRAEVHKYVDENGKTWLVGSGSANYKPEKPNPPPTQKKDEENKEKSVEIYVTAWCGYCRKLENFLKTHNIKYKRFDIEKDSEASSRFHSMGGSGVPLTKVGSKVIKGYNPNAILAAYNS